MKSFLTGLIAGMTLVVACSSGAKPLRNYTRNLQDKIWQLCEDNWVSGSPVGLVCNRVCEKRTKSGKCKDMKFKTNVKNICNERDFKQMRAISPVLVDEDVFF